jgi:hypothetical protein
LENVGFRFSNAVLILSLAGPLWAGQVETPVVGEATHMGTNPLVSAPAPISLTVSPLAGAFSPAPSLLAPAVPSAAASPALAPEAAPPLAAAAPAAAAGMEPGAADSGRALFDQEAARPAGDFVPAATPGLWGRIKNRLSIGEAVPAWPGREGALVRLGRIKAALDRRLSGDERSSVWTAGHELFDVEIFSPGSVDEGRREAALLRRIAPTDIPVAGLLTTSPDGSVLVKNRLNGETAAQILARGNVLKSVQVGWAELAAKLIKNGVAGDLSREGLVWERWRTRWVLARPGSLTAGQPRDVLAPLLSEETSPIRGDDGEFLSGLRGRLGPDSQAWAKTLSALESTPASAGALAALKARDAALPAPPSAAFGPAPKGPAGLDDSVVTNAEIVKRLGWDPLKAERLVNLHANDPGKMNTRILLAESPGRVPVVIKHSEWRIIRNEAALRRLARRFFGPSFRVPSSLSVNRGPDSYMVMESLDAAPSHYTDALNPEQRVAAALFVRTFGVGDVNPGNVLVPRDGGLPWLIDFEQALGRVRPVAGRVPDERIAEEMPWVSRREMNRIEDFQPAVRAWRALLAEPESRRGIDEDLRAAGFTAEESASLLAVFSANAADLDWILQNDVDFVNEFAERNLRRR